MPFELKGKVALVTGASRGLGKHIAKSLAAAGAKVAVNFCNSQQQANDVVDEITSAGGIAKAFQADVTDEESVKKLFADITCAWGDVDILVNNATGRHDGMKIENLTWQDYLGQLDFFLKAPFLCTKAAVASMKKNRYGRIINIGSEVVELGCGDSSHYVASKAAMLGLTRSLASELGPDGITVNLIAPGMIRVERHSDWPQQVFDDYAARLPLRRNGLPLDIGNAVVFLASEEANFITGQKLSVNGGNTLL